MKICHVCRNSLPITGKIGRTEECPFCHGDLHCCLNCSFFDPAASKQCREPVSEPVKDKQKANFCDYFRYADFRERASGTEVEKSRKNLEDLFKR